MCDGLAISIFSHSQISFRIYHVCIVFVWTKKLQVSCISNNGYFVNSLIESYEHKKLTYNNKAINLFSISTNINKCKNRDEVALW